MRTVSPSRQIFLRKTPHLTVGVFNLTLLPKTRKVKLYGCGGGGRYNSTSTRGVGSCYVNGYSIPVTGGESVIITVGAGATANDTLGNSSSFIVSGFPEKSITIPCAGFKNGSIAVGFSAGNYFLDLVIPERQVISSAGTYTWDFAAIYNKIAHIADGKPIYGFGSGYNSAGNDLPVIQVLSELLGGYSRSYFTGYGAAGISANGQNGFLTVEEYSE